MGGAEATNIDDDGELAGDGKLSQEETEGPGGVEVKVGEDELFFLTGEDGEVGSKVGISWVG